MKMMNKFVMYVVGVLVAAGSGQLHAQNGNYDNLFLGDGGTISKPFIQFEKLDGNSNLIVSNDSQLAFYVEDSYKLIINEDAPVNALQLVQDGVSVAGDVTASGYSLEGDGSEILFFDVNHSDTDQVFGISSISSNNGLHGGGIGLSTDSAYFPLWVFDSARNETLTMNFDGVAIGSYSPESALHVYADGKPFAEAKVTVENDLPGEPVQREMFELVNNGGSRFAFTDTSRDSKWFFASDSLGRFSVSLDGTGGPEFTIRPDGRVLMGAGSARNFDLRANGDLHIAGTLFQASDRNKKTAFEEVDTNGILEKIAAMPITTWQYKSDEETMRHIGPMSQDFRAAFGLGEDETSIATVDGIGVSLAAIQAIQRKLEEKDAELEDLNERLNEQAEMIERMALRMEALEVQSQK